MRIERVETEYVGNTVTNQRAMTIDPDMMGHIAHMLSNMYSNPVAAVIREYSCNGIDAHIASNQPNRPITISCPTWLEPVLSIRDYGNGLSDEDMSNLFGSYGSSSKRDTNNQIGGFGIGSKSAFSYASSFTIESFQEGIKNSYTAYMDQALGPQLELISSTKTDMPNGVNIKVNVKVSDIPDFEREITKFVQFQTSPIEVLNLDIKPLDVLFKNNSGFVLNQSSEYAIRMGGVCYKAAIFHSKRSPVTKKIILDFPIGSFKPAPSREELILKPEDVLILEEKVEEIVQEMYAEECSQLNNLTLFQAKVKIRQLSNTFRFKDHYEYKGRSLDQFVSGKNIWWSYRSRLKQCTGTRLAATNMTHIFDCEDKTFGWQAALSRAKSSNLSLDYVLVLSGTPKQRLKQWVRAGRPDLPYLNINDFKAPTTVSVRKQSKVKLKRCTTSRVFNEIELSLNDGEKWFYVKTNKNVVQLGDEKLNFSTSDLPNTLHLCGFPDRKSVLVVPKTLWSNIPDYWVDYTKHIVDTLMDCYNNPSLFAFNPNLFSNPDLYRHPKLLQKFTQNDPLSTSLLPKNELFLIDNRVSKYQLKVNAILDISRRLQNKRYPELVRVYDKNKYIQLVDFARQKGFNFNS